jgi:hypothetical protein
MIEIKFEGVGRNNATWKATLPNASDREMIREVKRHGALLSDGIEIEWNEDRSGGDIIVGGFRRVGSFEVVTAENPA